MTTGEAKGHYRPFAKNPWKALHEAMTDGFASFETSKGVPAHQAAVPPQARVSYLQNHDQIGNRAFGERLVSLVGSEQLHVMTAMLMLSPQIPLLFMMKPEDNVGEREGSV